MAAFAADYSGTYKGDVDSSSGKVENTLVLKMSGSELTGTLTNQFGVLPSKTAMSTARTCSS